MYCSTCGAALARDLTFCSHCGARAGGTKSEGAPKPDVSLENLVWAIVGVFSVGVGSMIGLTAVMKNYGLNDSLVLAFDSLILLMTLAIECVFISLLFSRRGGTKQAKDDGGQLVERRTQQTTNELEGAQPRALVEPLASVTEHTTRAFEPVYRERKPE